MPLLPSEANRSAQAPQEIKPKAKARWINYSQQGNQQIQPNAMQQDFEK